jgi:ketosteroid isomerase-like protein
VLAGALPADLARGDSLVANARALADRGRWSDAIERMSSVTVTWIEAQQTADARRVADSEAARTPTVQAPPPPPPSAPAARATARETTAVPPADPRVEIAAVLARYARALESRNLAELQGAYPGLTATQRQSWERFFRDVQEMRTSLTIDDLEVRGDAAAARVSGQYRYTAGSGGRQETQPVSFHATFRREGGAWRLAAVTQ